MLDFQTMSNAQKNRFKRYYIKVLKFIEYTTIEL